MPTPPPTATPTVAPTPDASPVRSAEAMPPPSPSVTRTVPPEPSASPTPSPDPPAIDYLPLAMGEPRALPAGLALFFGRSPCWRCDAGYVDILRVVFDAEARAFRVDRPLASLDGVLPQPASNSTPYHLPQDFAVSRSGREMAVAVCGVGACAWPMGRSEPDAERHVWFSRDGGGSWEAAGVALPGSFILEVTADDVLVWEKNEWYDRSLWDHLDDGEWAEFLAPLAPLGVTPSTSWQYRLRWLGSGEEFTAGDEGSVYPYRGWQDGQPDLPAPPALGGLEWRMADAHPDGAVAWRAWYEDDDDSLLAVADALGSLQGVYGLPSSGHRMSFVAENLLVRGVYRPPVEESPDEPPATEMELLDLATLRAHPIAGLSLPMDEGPASLGRSYGFLFARPAAGAAGEPSGAAPSGAPTPSPVTLALPPVEWDWDLLEWDPDFRRLDHANPRDLPAGYALIYAVVPCYGCGIGRIGDVRRAVFDEKAGTLREERLLAFFEERGDDAFGFAVSQSGREMAVMACAVGFCGPGEALPSEDAEQRLWTSDDGGGTWTNAGEVTTGASLLRVTADDIVLLERPTSGQELVRWFASGKELAVPAAPAEFVGGGLFAGWSEDHLPVWRFDDVHLAAGGDRVPAPDGTRCVITCAITNARGVSLIVANASGAIVLIDLAARRVHPLSGLPVASGYASDYKRPGVPAYYHLLRVAPAE